MGILNIWGTPVAATKTAASRFDANDAGQSVGGSISSSTIRYGYYGININGSSYNTLTSNNVYANVSNGIYAAAGYCTLASNNVFGNVTNGGNASGIYLQGSNCTLLSNNIYNNLSFGSSEGGITLYLGATNNLLVANNIYGNIQHGVIFRAPNVKNNTLISDNIYANGYGGSTGNGLAGIYAENSTSGSGQVCVNCNIGYTSAGTASADNFTEVQFDNTTGNNGLTLKNSLVNPSPGINTAELVQPGSYLLNYSTNTGVVQIYGDYQLSGSTLTLDYANVLYASTATTPADMSGHGNSATVNSTNDAKAVSQLVIATYNGSTWDIKGSSTGVICSGVSGATSATDCPSGAGKQFNITITNGGSVAAGDVLNFGLMAASNDAGVQKQLLFGPAASSFNNGRSKIEIASSGGFHAVGISTATSLIDMMASGSTYYTFVDSGALTLAYTTVQDADEMGLEFTGSSGISLATSTFDLSGQGVSSTSTYITAVNPLTSNATFYGLIFNNSRPNTYNHNIRLSGTDSGLAWTMQTWSGPLGGQPYTDYNVQPSTRVIWSNIPGDPIVTAVYSSSITVGAWTTPSPSNGYELDASTAPDFSGTLFSSSTTNSAVNSLTTPASLSPNTTYYMRLGNIVGSATSYVNVIPASTSTLANVVTGSRIYQTFSTSVTVNWVALAATPSSMTAEGYILQASTASNFSGTLYSSSTANVSLSTLTVQGLVYSTLYYFRVGSLNWNNVADLCRRPARRPPRIRPAMAS